jgi:4'-phosphopantetheinyl transferase EntD
LAGIIIGDQHSSLFATILKQTKNRAAVFTRKESYYVGNALVPIVFGRTFKFIEKALSSYCENIPFQLMQLLLLATLLIVPIQNIILI